MAFVLYFRAFRRSNLFFVWQTLFYNIFIIFWIVFSIFFFVNKPGIQLWFKSKDKKIITFFTYLHILCWQAINIFAFDVRMKNDRKKFEHKTLLFLWVSLFSYMIRRYRFAKKWICWSLNAICEEVLWGILTVNQTFKLKVWIN
jgi:hypothetical protein